VSRRSRSALMALVVVLMAMSGALLSPASAHAKLDSSNPVNGAALSTAPTTVSLTFDEPVTDPVLTSSDDVGNVVALGDPSISGSTITASWPSGTGGGLFRVEWQVKSGDGDTVDGVILFSIAGPKASGNTAIPAPGGTAGVSSESGLPGWLWLLALVLLVIVGAVAALALRARPPAPPSAAGGVEDGAEGAGGEGPTGGHALSDSDLDAPQS